MMLQLKFNNRVALSTCNRLFFRADNFGSIGNMMERKDAIGSLTSLRFFAAFAIVLHHSRGSVLSSDFMSGIPLSSGVSFFFVLSGFILAYVYSEKIGSIGLYEFYTARFARIWPAHIFTFLLVVVLFPSAEWVFGAELGWLVAMLNMSLLHSVIPVPAYYFSFNSVSWSISTEMFFYVLFPLLLCGLGRNWHIKLMGLLLLGGLSVYVLDSYHGNYYSQNELSLFSGHGLAYISPLLRVQEFFIGMVLFRVFDCIKNWRIFGLVSCTVLEVLCLVGVVFGTQKAINFAYALSGAGNPASGEFWGHCATGLIFGVVILCFGINKGLISKFIGRRFFVVLGEISFSMYLVHQIIFRFYNSHRPVFQFVPEGVIYPLLLVVVFIASYGMWRFIEIPLQGRLKRLFFGLRRNINKRAVVASS